MGVFTHKESVIVEDIDKNFKMNNCGFLRMLQEAANLASTSIGYGLTNMNETNTSWVLLNWRVKILKRPTYNDLVTIKTWASFSKGIYSTRSFELFVNDELIAYADSKWLYVNAITHSIEKITDEMIELYGPDSRTLFDTEYKDRTKMPEGLEELFSYTTIKRDLDANHHVNNIVFLQIANEVLDDSLLANSTDFSILYKKEISHGDIVSCYKTTDDTGNTIVFLYNKEKDILHGIIKMK